LVCLKYIELETISETAYFTNLGTTLLLVRRCHDNEH
jgi:hypothetical protein